MTAAIAVVGSLNVDVTLLLDDVPTAGQTVMARRADLFMGGKGANQAVAAARMGAQTYMVGAVGEDNFGRELTEGLNSQGVQVQWVRRFADMNSGMAIVMLEQDGTNRIIVAAGANALLLPADIDAAIDVFNRVDIVLLQLEIPIETVTYAAQQAKQRNKIVLLDPAPAPRQPLPQSLISAVDIVLPNRHEAMVLTGREVADLRAAKMAASDLLHMGFRKAIVKLDHEGSLLAENNRFHHARPISVQVVDTTAAGDAFAGALAAALTEGHPLATAMGFANTVAAMSTTTRGAMRSIPSRQQVQTWTSHGGIVR